ncbi:hypothetical protein L207DRAFT_588579 [Hyaloscypha variabilis F]|uniref:Uncharacterized protein n=1 Tax=Hyaloscypha variabilis (strain UAMH 11265 / GT02V1 / F) TaxID=1149755 RepID=A0A2J6R9A0_HYAVF|nr:hypothetical protein L207DRAFT_588579 [Hyaloscypha variabilis F]
MYSPSVPTCGCSFFAPTFTPPETGQGKFSCLCLDLLILNHFHIKYLLHTKPFFAYKTSEMASNGSDGTYEDAMGEFKFGERTFEDVDPVASGETAAPDTLFAVESTLAKEAERATYQAYSIRPTKGPIDNAEDDDRRWETTESTL